MDQFDLSLQSTEIGTKLTIRKQKSLRNQTENGSNATLNPTIFEAYE